MKTKSRKSGTTLEGSGRIRLFSLWAPVLLMVLLLSGPSITLAEPVVTMMIDPADGDSQRFARDLSILWERMKSPTDHRLRINPVAEHKTRLEKLRRGRGDFAVVSIADAARLLPDREDLRVVGLLWANYLHVLTTDPEKSVLELPLKDNLWIDDSAGYVHTALTEWGQGKPAQFRKFKRIPKDGLKEQFDASHGDLILFSSPVPSPVALGFLESRKETHLVKTSHRFMETLRLYFPWLQTERLPRGVYPGTNNRWVLPAWRTVLIARSDLAEPLATKMLRSVYRRSAVLERHNSLFESVEKKENAEFAKLFSFHPVSALFFGIQQP